MAAAYFNKKTDDGNGLFVFNGDLMTERGYVAIPNVVLRANQIFGTGTINHSQILSYASLLYVAKFQPSCREGQDALSTAVGMSIATMNKNLKQLEAKQFITSVNHGSGRPKRYGLNAQVSRETKVVEVRGDLQLQFEGADDFTGQGYTQWPNFILTDERLSSGEKVMLALHVMYAMRKAESFPFRETLGRLLGVRPQQAGILNKQLAEKGYIRVEQRGRMMSNKYHLQFGKAAGDKKPGRKSDKDAVLSGDGLFVPAVGAPEMDDLRNLSVQLAYDATKAILGFRFVEGPDDLAVAVTRDSKGAMISIDAIRAECRIDIYRVMGHCKISKQVEPSGYLGKWRMIKLVRR